MEISKYRHAKIQPDYNLYECDSPCRVRLLETMKCHTKQRKGPETNWKRLITWLRSVTWDQFLRDDLVEITWLFDEL